MQFHPAINLVTFLLFISLYSLAVTESVQLCRDVEFVLVSCPLAWNLPCFAGLLFLTLTLVINLQVLFVWSVGSDPNMAKGEFYRLVA
jgi:hypothetical protein